MTVAEVFAALAERGVWVELDAMCDPLLCGPKDGVTPALLRLLKAHRGAVVAALLAAPPGGPREFRWADGLVVAETPLPDGSPPEPLSAGDFSEGTAWRRAGEAAWRMTPRSRDLGVG